MHCVLLLRLSQKEALAEAEDRGGNKAVAFTAHKMHEVRADIDCGCALKDAVVGLNLHTQHGSPRENRWLKGCQQCSQYFHFRNDVYLSAATALLSRLQSFPYQLGTDLKLIYHLFSKGRAPLCLQLFKNN